MTRETTRNQYLEDAVEELQRRFLELQKLLQEHINWHTRQTT